MKPLNWKLIARIAYAYLATASTLALFVFLVRFTRAFIELFLFVVRQPETFFTNKVLFIMLVAFSAGSGALYWFAYFTMKLAEKSRELWKDLLRPWRCRYGGRACEVGKKGIERPRFFCSRHFMERLETRVAVQHMKAPKRRATT